MKLLIVVLGLALAHAGPLFNEEWETWKSMYNKVYTAEEEMKRQYIWQKNLMYVVQHNLEADQGKHTYRLHTNEFADMDEDEWRTVMTGSVTRSVGVGSFCNMSYVVEDHFVAPKMVDWRTKGYVTPIKNQKQCGSCWAFSATGSLEGQHFKKTGNLVSLSEQNLIDCSKMEGNMGCRGGLMDNAFKYIYINHGIDSEMSYPYKAMDDPSCGYMKRDKAATLSGCVDIERFSETGLQSAVSSVGPISVAIDAGHKSFQLYHSGVYYEPECSSTKLDHGVLAVGYGEDNGQAYWLVKNSWGTAWGMEGYIMMSRNKKNNCGIATQASYPVV